MQTSPLENHSLKWEPSAEILLTMWIIIKISPSNINQRNLLNHLTTNEHSKIIKRQEI